MSEMPMFVRLEDYDKSLKFLEKSKDQLENAKDLLHRLEALKDKEFEELHKLGEELSLVESKINELNAELKKPE